MVKADSIDEAMIGGNASAEGGEDEAAGGDGATTSGVDVVLRHRLTETGFAKKKDYQGHIKVSVQHCSEVYNFFTNGRLYGEV